MSDLLDPNEVNALLAAVKSGDVKFPAEEMEPSGEEVLPYDFGRPERMSRDQLRAITTLCEGWARSVSSGLSGLLRTTVDVNVASAEQLTYSEFISGLASPTALAILSTPALTGCLILEMSPGIVYPVLDRMLGGNQEEVAIPERSLTDIEQRLFRKVVERIAGSLDETWGHVLTGTFRISSVVTNPQRVQEVGPHEPVVAVTCEMAMGNHSGMMGLCIPYATIEPVMGQLTPGDRLGTGRKAPNDANVVRVTKALGGTALEMVAYLAETSITVGELLELQVGDVIKTNLPVDGEITLCVDGQPKFKGTPGRVRRNKGVQITRRLSTDSKD